MAPFRSQRSQQSSGVGQVQENWLSERTWTLKERWEGRQQQTAESVGDLKRQSLPGDAPKRVARDGRGLCSVTRGLATRQRTLCSARCQWSGAGEKLISDIVTAGWPLVAASQTIRPSGSGFGWRQIFFFFLLRLVLRSFSVLA